MSVVAVALGEVRQALQLHLLDQPPAVRRVLGFAQSCAIFVGGAARAERRRDGAERGTRRTADAAPRAIAARARHAAQAMRPDVGELGLAA